MADHEEASPGVAARLRRPRYQPRTRPARYSVEARTAAATCPRLMVPEANSALHPARPPASGARPSTSEYRAFRKPETVEPDRAKNSGEPSIPAWTTSSACPPFRADTNAAVSPEDGTRPR